MCGYDIISTSRLVCTYYEWSAQVELCFCCVFSKMVFHRIIGAWTAVYCMFKRWCFGANKKNGSRSISQGVETIIFSRKIAKWYTFIAVCGCKILYGFEESGLRPSTAIHAADKSMLILMFAEKATKLVLKLRS